MVLLAAELAWCLRQVRQEAQQEAERAARVAARTAARRRHAAAEATVTRVFWRPPPSEAVEVLVPLLENEQ